MTNAYCTLEDVKASLAGDGHNMSSTHDQSIVNKILEASRAIDREVARCRGAADSDFSFLADQLYGRQIIYLSSTPAPQSGTFVLAFEGEVTDPISATGSAADVQAALGALTGISGNVAVTGFDGGPFTVDFTGGMTGPQATITGRAYFDVTDGTVVVLPLIQGKDTVPSLRYFRPMAPLYGKLLFIDDCVEVVGVTTRVFNGTDESLSPDGYLHYPMRGTPVEGLHLANNADWPEYPGTVAVNARWGYALEVPYDVKDICTIETIRSHFSSQSGNDDRLGMTPFGSVMTSKAFTSKFMKLKETYGGKLW